MSGVYYSPHVSSLISVLKAQSIPFKSTTSICAPVSGGSWGAQQGTLAGIEQGFQTLRVLGFREICGYKWDMTLTVKGDMRFRYDFRHDASVDQTLMELLRKIKNCGEKMRDQVGLYFCAAIRDYRTWTILGRPHGPYAIDMTIDL